MKLIPLFFLLLLLPQSATAQTPVTSRNLLQQHYLVNTFIMPQLKKGPVKLARTEQVDSLFRVWQSGWRSVAADSMAANPTQLTSEEFANLDAYCYFWGLASISRDLDIADRYGSLLVSRYMAPALQRDLLMLKRLPVPELIDQFHSGNLGNTISIGSFVNSDQQAFTDTYAVYTAYRQIFQDLAARPDTAVSARARKQLATLQKQYYSMNARSSYYQGNAGEAFTYLADGLSADTYSRTRAVDMARKLATQFTQDGDPGKAYAVLSTIALHTTPDNLNRDTLAALYTAVDPVRGPEMYQALKSKLSGSSFKTGSTSVRLPAQWSFVANAVPAEKLKAAKFIFLDFWYTGCAPCLAEVPALNAFYQKMRSRADVVFISVNTDYVNGKTSPAFVAKRSSGLGIAYPVVYDTAATALSKQLGITAYPTKVIIGINGQQQVKTDSSPVTMESLELFLREGK